MKTFAPIGPTAALALAMLLGGCAASAPTADAGRPSATAVADLGCTLPSNCVSSADGGMAPLRYEGTPAQGLAALQATLATFAEAHAVRTEALAIEAIFSTSIGFRDQIDFRIDPQGKRIDFRSRSLFGLYDFGKNRSRMAEFRVRFDQQTKR